MISKQILLVEDDAWLSDLYDESLKSLAQITRVDSAEAALEALDGQKFDLILLDMFLPEHSGIEFLHEVASYQDSADIPIIILSAVHPRDFALPESRWDHYGVVEYLYKPITKPKVLHEVISKHLASYRVSK